MMKAETFSLLLYSSYKGWAWFRYLTLTRFWIISKRSRFRSRSNVLLFTPKIGCFYNARYFLVKARMRVKVRLKAKTLFYVFDTRLRFNRTCWAETRPKYPHMPWHVMYLGNDIEGQAKSRLRSSHKRPHFNEALQVRGATYILGAVLNE